MVLRLTSRSPRRPCFVVTVACAPSRRLDASIGASEPHDLAVRFSIIRPARIRARLTLPRPPHPAPNVRDDREAPLLWARDSGSPSADLPGGKSGIFLISGLDTISENQKGFARRADLPQPECPDLICHGGQISRADCGSPNSLRVAFELQKFKNVERKPESLCVVCV